MSKANDYLEWNKEAWNRKVPYHMASSFYNLDSFLKGESSLKSPELALLGNVENKKVIHFQCHFGQDSICLSRLGARVTGVDFSNLAIQEAKKLSILCGQPTEFLEIGKFIEESDLSKTQIEDIFCNSTLEWLELDINNFV